MPGFKNVAYPQGYYQYLHRYREIVKYGNTMLFHQEVPRNSSWLMPMVGGLVALTLIPGLIFLFFNTELATAMFILSAFDGLLFYTIIPRRFEIYEDKFRIQLGWPVALNISLRNIQEAKPGNPGDVVAYWGIRFGTSTTNVVEIVRRRGMNIIITPQNAEEFIDQLNQAIARQSA
jgi:hypothetical protein